MKICYLGDNAPRLVNLMADMRDRGHEVHWIALNCPKFKIEGIRIHSDIQIYGKSMLNRYGLFPYYLAKLKKKLKYISPEIVHAINIEWAGWLAVLNGMGSTVISTQGSDVMQRKELKTDFIHNVLRRYTIRRASVITYGNDTMLRDINTWARPKKAFKYFAGVSFPLLENQYQINNLRQKYNIVNKKIVFSPRTFVANSNIDKIIKCIPVVSKLLPDVVFMFAYHYGKKEYKSYIDNLIKQLGVEDYCIFLSKILPEEMPSYYHVSDLVISILSSDGMPATLLESMAMKKTLILSDIPTYKNLVDKNFALFAENNDVESISKAVVKGLNKDKKIDEMIQNAYNWVLKNGDVKVQNGNLEQLYFSLQKSGGKINR